ncbi:MAG: DHH family phosphoesterase, partial [Oscillospiraceae bacterium]
MSEVLTLVNVVTRLLEKDNILILCHKNPDGDTLGSAGALAMALKSLKKTVAILCEDRIPDRYDYMEIEIFDGGFEPEYIVSVDVAGLQLFGDSVVGYGEKCDLCIDHHPSNTGFAKATFVQGNAAATAEIIFDIITQMEVRLTGQMADCLYTGVA